MPGKNFKQGYTCRKCVTEGLVRALKRPALYKRISNKYIFSGYVECFAHGIQKAIPLREVR